MKILCVGRNYADHAREMQAQRPRSPVLFLKPATALLPGGGRFVLPPFSSDVHYECELVLRIGTPGKNLPAEAAWTHVDGIGLGIDFTARDLQAELKQAGLPWEKAKAFDGSAPVSEFWPPARFGNFQELRFRLERNGEVVQTATPASMLFDVPALLAAASGYFSLEAGDLVFTGTPAGVGPVAAGDELQGFLNGEPVLRVDVTAS